MISTCKNNRAIYLRRFVALFLSLLSVFMLRSSRVLEKPSCDAPLCFPKAEQEVLEEYNSAPLNIRKIQEVRDAQPAEHDTSSTASTPSSSPISSQNDVDEVIEEPDIVVGLENLKVFEEFGASSIYVRNDIYKTDYEVIRDDWNYSDLKEQWIVKEPSIVKEKKPHQL